MGPTPKAARARQSPSDDAHTTIILLEIDLVVWVCDISEASANLPGPAEAKAMSVSNFLSWTAHLVWSPISHKKQKSTNIILGRMMSSALTSSSVCLWCALTAIIGCRPWGCTVTVTVSMARMDWAVRDKRSWNKKLRATIGRSDATAAMLTWTQHA